MNNSNENKVSYSPRYPMPRGLPRLIGVDKSGYERLNKFLGITRKQRKAILETKWARTITRPVRDEISRKRLPAGERDRRLMQRLYGDPSFRKDMWASTFEILENGDEFEPKRIPTIEQNALSTLYSEFGSAKKSRSIIKKSFGEWSELAEQNSRTIPWVEFAAFAWGQLIQKFDSQHSPTDQEKELLVIQIFSIATIVDDHRLLLSSVQMVDWLQDEFVDMLKPSNTNSDDDQHRIHMSNPTKKWKECCDKLSSMASEASGKDPNLDALADMQELIKDLELIERSLSNELENSRKFVAHLESLFDSISNESCFSWLNEIIQREIENQWLSEQYHIESHSIAEFIDSHRKIALKNFDSNREAAIALDSEKRELDSLGESAPSNFGERHQWEEKRDRSEKRILEHKEKVRLAEKAVYEALLPKKRQSTNDKVLESEETKEEVEIIQPVEIEQNKGQRQKKPIYPKEGKVKDRTKQVKECTSEAADKIVKALLETPPRLAYAFQVAQLAQEFDENFPNIPITTLQAVLYSDYLRHPDGQIALALQTIFSEFVTFNKSNSDSERDISSLLTFAATLRPSLLAPISGAFSFLSGISTSNFEAVYSFAKAISEKTKVLQNVRVDSRALRSARSEVSWEKEFNSLMDDAEKLRNQARHTTMNYAPATKVWQHWHKPNGFLEFLVSYVLSSKKVDTAAIESSIAEIEDRKSFEKRVRHTDRHELQRKRGADIVAPTLDRLHNRTQEVASLARRKLSLENVHSPQSGFLVSALTDLRMVVETEAPKALTELRNFVKEEQSVLAGVANTAAYAIDRFVLLFDPDHERLVREPDPKILVASGLFDRYDVAISDLGVPENYTKATLEELIFSNATHSLKRSFDQRLKSGDLKAAEQIIHLIETEEPVEKDSYLESLSHAQDKQINQLKKNISTVREKVENALMLGYISDAERFAYEADLVKWEKLFSENFIFRSKDVREALSKIESHLQKSLEEQKNKVQVDLDSLKIDHDDERYKQISNAIDQDDIVSANELIDRVRNNEPIARGVSKSSFDFREFFPQSINNINKFLEQQKSKRTNVINQIQKGENFAGQNFGRVTGAQRDSATRMLDAWYVLKKAESKLPDICDRVKEIFSELGFLIKGVEAGREIRDFVEVYLAFESFGDRVQCPVPYYGSNASGRYRVVVLWNRPAVEDIVRFAEDGSTMCASIVLFMGRMTEEKRRNVAQISRERSKTLLVVDETLLIYLCAETGSRIPTLFNCTIPFSYVQPFVTTAGLVPPEMFYGREREIREVADPMGPCFIYGGRQLGKTALLRAVERMVHSPDNGQYALWLDLKVEGVGHDREPEEVWHILWKSLKNIDAISDDIPEPSINLRGRIDEFIDYLTMHFSKESRRTLLLLLDEADRFLEVDAREVGRSKSISGYRESSRLKGLMDGTERSIKVVFAGLHNVLRTVEYSNHPLGHFGQPIQIGPLLADGAWRSAEELLREPMSASGYMFDSPNLITRVLAQTNYYPSLIQLYGEALIKAMVPHRTTGAPLYSINEEVLDETYQSRNLRDMIRSRFHLTLQLDPRYEIIAYTIANCCLENSSILSDGLDEQIIDDYVRFWWREGFHDIESGTERFRSLLDEMVGLGVLRITHGRSYTLRNPNILLFMGSKDEISDNLLRDRELPHEFEREIYRARDPKKPNSPTRNPLTFYQEDFLRKSQNGVTVLCGLQASGLNEVIPFLQSRDSENQVKKIEGVFDRVVFERKLKQLDRDRRKGTTIYVVAHTEPWSEEWVNSALERISKLRAKGRYSHVLFLADGAHLWQLYKELDQLNKHGLNWLSLKPWDEKYLRQWMEDVEFGDNQVNRTDIKSVTGLWPYLLMQMHNLTPEHGELNSGLEKLKIEMNNQKSDASIKAQFGLDDPNAFRALRPLAIFGKAGFDELLDEVVENGVDSRELRLRLNWAQRLRLVSDKGQDEWEFDKIAATAIVDT